MPGFGTALNMLAMFVELTVASQGESSWMAVTIDFAPLPHSILLIAVVGRALPRSRLTVIGSLAWLAAMTVV
jgi:hypothetical protein